MTFWELFIIVYLTGGVITTACASIGHRKRFGYPLHWSMKLLGVLIWPGVLLFGGRKK